MSYLTTTTCSAPFIVWYLLCKEKLILKIYSSFYLKCQTWSFFFQLYGEFADPFKLSECKLAIIHCAGHSDPILVQTLWQEIIEKGKFKRTKIGSN